MSINIMIDYPPELDIIFKKLKQHEIKPVIVGGFVRDSLLQINSNDIDIELYGVSTLDEVENILQEFGDISSVGKSFGVCKLSFKNLDLDFSLPRIDKKNSQGHKGFKVTTHSNLEFKTAARRRDFTINAIGFDIQEKKLLDPYNGIEDLKNRALHVVDKNSFIEDPLRVLRAAQFSARFNLIASTELITLCKEMINNSLLNELPRERIFDEIKKLLLKSSSVSIGFNLLKKMDALKYFTELGSLTDSEWGSTLEYLNTMNRQRTDDKKSKLVLMLTTTCNRLNKEKTLSFMSKLTNDKELIKKVLALHESSLKTDITNYQLYSKAENVNLQELLTLSLVLHNDNIQEYKKIEERVIKLNILNKKMPAILQGRDLIELGLKPSKEFSNILYTAYEAQKNELFKNHNEALVWLKEKLIT